MNIKNESAKTEERNPEYGVIQDKEEEVEDSYHDTMEGRECTKEEE